MLGGDKSAEDDSTPQHLCFTFTLPSSIDALMNTNRCKLKLEDTRLHKTGLCGATQLYHTQCLLEYEPHMYSRFSDRFTS